MAPFIYKICLRSWWPFQTTFTNSSSSLLFTLFIMTSPSQQVPPLWLSRSSRLRGEREFPCGFFSFPSRSRIVGIDFFIPFPFPNLLFHRRESKRELDYCKRYQASNFFSFLYISQNNYIEEVNWAKMFKSEWLKRQDILLSFVANSFAAKVLVIVNKIILFWFFAPFPNVLSFQSLTFEHFGSFTSSI